MNFAPDDVLQRFVRGDASRTTEGSGLGLSIAQSFMQNFGGGLEVGVQGDTFTVTLTFPGSAAAGNGAAPAARMEVFGTAAKTTAEIRSMRRSRMHCPVRPQTYPVRIRTRPAGRAPQRRKHRNRAASPPASRTPRLCQKHPQARPAQRKTNKPPAGRTVQTAVPRTAKLRPFPIKQPQPLVLLPKQLHGRNQKSRCLRKACRLLKQRKTAVPPPRFPLTGGAKSIEPPTTKHKAQKRSRIS